MPRIAGNRPNSQAVKRSSRSRRRAANGTSSSTRRPRIGHLVRRRASARAIGSATSASRRAPAAAQRLQSNGLARVETPDSGSPGVLHVDGPPPQSRTPRPPSRRGRRQQRQLEALPLHLLRHLVSDGDQADNLITAAPPQPRSLEDSRARQGRSPSRWRRAPRRREVALPVAIFLAVALLAHERLEARRPRASSRSSCTCGRNIFPVPTGRRSFTLSRPSITSSGRARQLDVGLVANHQPVHAPSASRQARSTSFLPFLARRT